MTNTIAPPKSDFTSARNPNGQKPVGVAAIENKKQRINVRYNSNAWDHIPALEQADRDLLCWFHMHSLDKGWNSKQIGEIIGYSETTAYRVLNGTYDSGKWPQIVDKIRSYQLSIPEKKTMPGIDIEPDFVFTEAAETFWQGLEYASRGGFTILAGESGSGKTKTCAEWDIRHPGRIKRINAPSIGSHTALVRMLAQKLGFGWRKRSVTDLMLTMFQNLSDRDILIIDQGSRLIPNENQIQAKSLEILMDLNEETGCGIIIPLTKRDVKRLGTLRYQIEQITGRAEIFAAPAPHRDQVKAIASQFGKFKDSTITALHDLALRPGALRTVTKVLNLADRVARLEGCQVDDDLIAEAIKNRFDRQGGSDLFNGQK